MIPMKRLLLLCALAVSSAGQSPVCGGPTYPCSLHQTAAQLSVIPLPNPIPDMGNLTGSGTCLTIPPYTGQVCRCTDVNTDPGNARTHSFTVTDTGGANVYQSNSDQTMWRIVASGTGSTLVVIFDKTTNKCSTALPNTSVPAGAQWSLNLPNVDYSQQGMTKIIKRTFNGIQPPSVQTLFDFANCSLMNGLGTVTYNTQINTNDDNIFTMAFGVNGQNQDKAQYVIAYRLDNGVCGLLNTITGQVQLAGGIPNLVSIGQVSTFYPFTVHSADMIPGGQVAIGAVCDTCPKHGPFIWYPATTKMDLITTLTGGHSTSSVKSYVNITNAPRMAIRPYANLTHTSILNTATFNFPTPDAMHISWQNNNGDDTAPICASEMSWPTIPPPITVPLQNEIFCVDPLYGTYIRLTKSFSSGASVDLRVQSAIFANGQLGYIAFSSDWMGTLGNQDGVSSKCIIGAKPPNACRSDVFIKVPY